MAIEEKYRQEAQFIEKRAKEWEAEREQRELNNII